MAGHKGELCIYCGKDDSSTKGDHVPELCFFPDGELKNHEGRPSVPACIECNSEYNAKDHLELRFLLSFSWQSYEHVPLKVIAATERWLEQNPRFKETLIRKAKDFKGIRAGKLVSTGVIPMDSLFLKRYTVRLVCAFHYLFKKEVFPKTHEEVWGGWDWNWRDIIIPEGEESLSLKDPIITELFESKYSFEQNWEDPITGKSIFKCRFSEAVGSQSSGLWQFIFYDSFLLWALTTPFDKRKEKGE